MIPTVFAIVESGKQCKYLSQGRRATFGDLLIPGRALGTNESSLFVTCSHLLVPFCKGKLLYLRIQALYYHLIKKL